MTEADHPSEETVLPDGEELDLTEGASPSGPRGAGSLDGDGPPPGHPAAATPAGSPGEVASKGPSPAGPSSPTTGTAPGTGADRDDEGVPPTAPG